MLAYCFVSILSSLNKVVDGKLDNKYTRTRNAYSIIRHLVMKQVVWSGFAFEKMSYCR